MLLSDHHKQLLHEVYEVPYSQTTVLTAGGGSAVAHTLFDVQVSVRQQLMQAIAQIDTDPAKATRVSKILDEYETIALDFSTIDRDGYKLNPNRNLKRIKKALYTYTGIWYEDGNNGNRLPIG